MVLTNSSEFWSYLYKTKKQYKKFQPDSNILISPEAGWERYTYYPMLLYIYFSLYILSPMLLHKSENKKKNEIK